MPNLTAPAHNPTYRSSSGSRSNVDQTLTRQPICKPLSWKETFGADNKQDGEDYLFRFERYASAWQWDERSKIASFLSTLTGRAAKLIRRIPDNSDWNTVKKLFLEHWEPPSRKKALKETFSNTNRARKETAEDYLERLNTLARRAFANYPDSAIDDQILTQFVNGQPDHVQNSIIALSFNNVDEALAAVVKIDTHSDRTRRAGVRRFEHDNHSPTTGGAQCRCMTSNDQHNSTSSTDNDNTVNYDSYCYYDIPTDIPTDSRDWLTNALNNADTEDDGRYDEDSLYSVLRIAALAKNETSTAAGRCFFCKRPGHRWSKCFKLRDILIKNGMKSVPSNRDGHSSNQKPGRSHDNKATVLNLPEPLASPKPNQHETSLNR